MVKLRGGHQDPALLYFLTLPISKYPNKSLPTFPYTAAPSIQTEVFVYFPTLLHQVSKQMRMASG